MTTKDEHERMDRLSRMGCIVCRASFGSYVDAEIQHLTAGGRRLGHEFTIPLCPWHHRAVPSGGLTPEYMRQVYGPSFAESRAAFEQAFGTEEFLLEETNIWLGLGYRDSPGSGKYIASSSANSTTPESIPTEPSSKTGSDKKSKTAKSKSPKESVK